MAFADKILLNKVDLVSEAEKDEVISRLKASPHDMSMTCCPVAGCAMRACTMAVLFCDGG